MSDAPNTPRSRSRRWLAIGLVASLGLNLAVAGVVAGLAIKGPPGFPGIGLWRYGVALPDPYRHDLGRELRRSRGDWAGARDGLRAQRGAFAAALTAEPFDPAAVARILDADREQMSTLARRAADLLLAQIARMSPEERAAYARSLERDRDHPPGRRP